MLLDLSTMGRITTLLGCVREVASCDKAGLTSAHRIQVLNVLKCLFGDIETGGIRSDAVRVTDDCEGMSSFRVWVGLVAKAARNRYAGKAAARYSPYMI